MHLFSKILEASCRYVTPLIAPPPATKLFPYQEPPPAPWYIFWCNGMLLWTVNSASAFPCFLTVLTPQLMLYREGKLRDKLTRHQKRASLPAHTSRYNLHNPASSWSRQRWVSTQFLSHLPTTG
ncbi:hypothetical protein HJG60_011453 [Phyllostomus discolor]|uniref:Uncharacterized protein n=1 Tax=Phyllostomus discolor TaxID=89673 RepID=A0A833ZMN8_9CHIR|nr:hypothetical protein HJG60_011453 [Phyllostomus discolor]